MKKIVRFILVILIITMCTPQAALAVSNYTDDFIPISPSPDDYYLSYIQGDVGVEKNLTATPTDSIVYVDGVQKNFQAYNVDGNNYLKLRDLAYTLSGSPKQFDVVWDSQNGTINLLRNQPYTVVGGEMTGKGSSAVTPVETGARIILDSQEVSLFAYIIEGNNYFKLRDIAEIFDFNVTWDGTNNAIIIHTSESYSADYNIQIDRATDELLDNYISFHEYINDEDGARLIIRTDTEIKDFAFISVDYDNAGDKLFFLAGDTLFSVDELSPEKPFVVKLMIPGSVPAYGISFVDENGVERYYTINLSGRGEEEGPPYILLEFENGNSK